MFWTNRHRQHWIYETCHWIQRQCHIHLLPTGNRPLSKQTSIALRQNDGSRQNPTHTTEMIGGRLTITMSMEDMMSHNLRQSLQDSGNEDNRPPTLFQQFVTVGMKIISPPIMADLDMAILVGSLLRNIKCCAVLRIHNLI